GGDALHQGDRVLRLKVFRLELAHPAVVTDDGRLPDGNVEVGGLDLDDGREQLFHQDGSHGITSSTGCVRSRRRRSPAISLKAPNRGRNQSDRRSCSARHYFAEVRTINTFHGFLPKPGICQANRYGLVTIERATPPRTSRPAGPRLCQVGRSLGR